MKKKHQTAIDKNQKRLQLEKKLIEESKLVEKESMKVLKEFEKLPITEF